MLFTVWLPLLLQLVFPLGLLAWSALGRPGNGLAWALRAATIGSYLVAIAVAGLWLVLPYYLPALYGIGLLAATVSSLRRLRGVSRWPSDRRGVAASAGLAVAAGSCLALLAWVASGWQAPADAVELSFPLGGRGTYLIVNGGSREVINAHLGTLRSEKFRRWRGQSHGVDIVKLDATGLRARGILPSDPAAYAIFGDPIRAPCAGTVVTTADGSPEMPPPRADRRNLPGNHVILRCGEVWVLLGHMRQGSVAVRASDSVAVGEPLGRVGNTGNTDEPHLHIHAQRPGTVEAPMSGDPLPIRFGAIYPSRNTRFHR
jgi:hypothetical protein